HSVARLHARNDAASDDPTFLRSLRTSRASLRNGSTLGTFHSDRNDCGLRDRDLEVSRSKLQRLDVRDPCAALYGTTSQSRAQRRKHARPGSGERSSRLSAPFRHPPIRDRLLLCSPSALVSHSLPPFSSRCS